MELYLSRSKRSAFLAAFAMVAVSALAACGSNPDTAPVVVSAIAITAPGGAIPVTGTMQFHARVTDASGSVLTTTPTWTVVNGGGTITSAGLFTAGDSTGTFVNTIVATIGSVTSTSSVTVSAGGLANITIAPLADTLAVDATKEFAAAGTDAFGHAVDLPAGVVWTVSSPTAGTVDSTGHFSAGSVAGSYTLTATSGTVTGHATILVVAGPLASIVLSPAMLSLDQGATQQFTAVGHDVHGNVVTVAPTWSVVLGGTVDQNGLFTAGTVAGPFFNTVTATSGAISGTASVTVNPGPLATIIVSPLSQFTFRNGTVQFTATGRDATGNDVAITPVWSVTSSSLGSISQNGLLSVSNIAAGNYSNNVVATSGTVSGSASVLVYSLCPPFCGGIP